MKILSLSNRYVLRITLIYFLVAGCWIFFSDRLIASLITEHAFLSQMQTYKGLFFVLVTTGLLYYLINKHTSSLMDGQKSLEKVIDEKKVLLRELHHRVKNNLAIITALLELQSQGNENSNVLRETQYRICTLADIEELMYQQNDFTSIPIHECMSRLISKFERSLHFQSSVKAQIDEINLNINQAIPLGLMVNEILSQFRVDSSPTQIGLLKIGLNYNSPDRVSLSLEFDKVPPEITTRLVNNRFIEATLIDIYTKQLKATSSWRPTKEGGKFSLEFAMSDNPGPSSQLKETFYSEELSLENS